MRVHICHSCMKCTYRRCSQTPHQVRNELGVLDLRISARLTFCCTIMELRYGRHTIGWCGVWLTGWLRL